MKLHDFLVERAKFPFPATGEHLAESSTDISQFDLGLLDKEWKAEHAVRDDALVENLCQTLENILGDMTLTDDGANYLLRSFSPKLQVDEAGAKRQAWATNSSEARSRSLLDKGFFEAVRRFLWHYNQSNFEAREEDSVKGCKTRVDYVALVDDEPKLLVEAKSPAVMKKVYELLPQHGVKLKWIPHQSLIPKFFSQAALYLGLRHMTWLFLTCHNYWIVCRLVRDDEHPYLVYSPQISIKDSSEPFRAYLGALLSVVKGVPVKLSPYGRDMQLDSTREKGDEESPPPEDDADNGSGEYQGKPGGASTSRPVTCSHARDEHRDTEPELVVTSSSPDSPEDFQIWVCLYSMSNNTLSLPQNSERCLWLTQFIASGSTGNIWRCHFNNSDDFFAAKVTEVLHSSDASSRQRLHNEFSIYLALNMAYQTGQLPNRIAPRCYGAFEGNHVDILILDLCDSVLNEWGELSVLERSQVFKLVQDLHHVGIMHGDLEPRNIARVSGGGFLLIDFSESRKHICRESKDNGLNTQAAPARKHKCSELQTLRKQLERPLRDDHVNMG